MFSVVLSLFRNVSLSAQNEILFFQTNWGFEGSWDEFCKKSKASQYDGIEVWVPQEKEGVKLLQKALLQYDLKVIYLCGVNRSLPFKDALEQYKADLINAIALNPIAINSHTGSDFFSVEENIAFIEIAQKLSEEFTIPIYHETHRGRFSYSLPGTLQYLEQIPALKFNLDVSHWMVVHESLLQSQQDLLQKIAENTYHIHARIGFEEGPQVNDPQAPEWNNALNRHLDLWEAIIQKRIKEAGFMTITTEFGPPTYMPTAPYTQTPLSNQWENNVFIMNAIKKKLNP